MLDLLSYWNQADAPQAPTLIYHYSSKPLSHLMTMKHQHDRGMLDENGVKKMNDLDASAKHRGQPPYSQHVSFFFDRPPFQLMLKKFRRDHIFWREGATVYEHVVDVSQLAEDTRWIVHSTPIDLFFYDWFWSGRPNTHVTHHKLVFKLRNLIKSINGDVGNDRASLEQVIQKYKGVTKQDFVKGFNHPEYQKNKSQQRTWYAPRVRHLNVFVDEPIPVKHTRAIKLTKGFQPQNQGQRQRVTATYQEEPGSSFTHNNVKYDLNKLLTLMEDMPVTLLPTPMLAWVLKHDKPDPKRLMKADITVPILVHETSHNGVPLFTTIDGLHRLAKAIQQNKPVVKAKMVPDTLLHSCIIH